MAEEKKQYKFDYVINPDECMSCAACEVECADNSVFVDDTVHYAINLDSCKRCGKCFRACPVGAIARVKK
ncbi:4Fe-4S binding protein [Desulfolucanica intricata]|uniref:4Fe-4S binding protein n=1 Tax=Desulfolucanica intricata TaxID=1285191 RepID=UPI0008346D47|nr:4Fe-4S binding protein [Desulfolucanica intricata]